MDFSGGECNVRYSSEYAYNGNDVCRNFRRCTLVGSDLVAADAANTAKANYRKGSKSQSKYFKQTVVKPMKSRMAGAALRKLR
jgi:hypothetical protein